MHYEVTIFAESLTPEKGDENIRINMSKLSDAYYDLKIEGFENFGSSCQVVDTNNKQKYILRLPSVIAKEIGIERIKELMQSVSEHDGYMEVEL